MRRLPVGLQSLVVQCVALVAVAGFAYLASTLLSFEPAAWQLAAAQGVLAALLSAAVRQPAWWPPLHLVFAPAVLLAHSVDVPAWIYLAAFLTLTLFYWSTFRTRVPLYLSDRKAWRALVPLLPHGRDFSFIDVGSGLGDVPFYLEPRFPQGRFVGTEIAPAPWLISRVRAWSRHSRVRLLRRDYARVDLSRFDVVFAFLSPAAMPALWRQAQAQMQPGSLFISLSFDVPGCAPDREIALAPGSRHTLHVWHMRGGAA